MSKTKKRGRKVMTIIAIVLGIMVSINLVSLAINQLFFRHELDNMTPRGQLVEVNGRNMHIYSMGQGERTIVLLPGCGTPLPSADFGPLMRELSQNNTVVCVEYFGYGFSDETEAPRTNENMTQEIKAALSKAGFAPPYVLMPHSASGVYSEYYASTYPDEVSAIIMLDTTSTAKTEPSVPGFVYELGKVQQAIGINRYFNPIIVSKVLSMTQASGYTKQEIDDYTKFMNHANNDNLIDQMKRLNSNILEVMNLSFPDEIPVLKIIASGTIKQVGEEYQTKHLGRLGSNVQSITLDGSHYIYHTNLREVSEATNKFLNEK